MGFMDTAMQNFKPVVADELEIELPVRREPKASEAEAASRELGQHGGAAESVPGSVDAHADTAGGAAASAADPSPQRDEPDDGEHTDSTEEAVAARVKPLVNVDVDEATDEQRPTSEPVQAEMTLSVAVEPDPPRSALETEERPRLRTIVGSQPQPFQRVGFSSGDAATVQVKRFPQPLIDHLRHSLAPAVGGDFAEAMSSTALITAFLVAKTGLSLDVDANTAVAIEAFRSVDPRLLSVEEQLTAMSQDLVMLMGETRKAHKRMSETAAIVDAVEFSNAYLIADRVAQLTTPEVNEQNVEITQKKVLTARDRIRTQSVEHRKIEREREGRRMP